jgi:hypothetical protein
VTSAIFQLYYDENKLFLNDHDEVRFVLDQHTELDFYSASSPINRWCNGSRGRLECVRLWVRTQIRSNHRLKTTSAIFQLYYDENKLFLNDDHDEVRFVLDQHTVDPPLVLVEESFYYVQTGNTVKLVCNVSSSLPLTSVVLDQHT